MLITSWGRFDSYVQDHGSQVTLGWAHLLETQEGQDRNLWEPPMRLCCSGSKRSCQDCSEGSNPSSRSKGTMALLHNSGAKAQKVV